MYGDFEKHDDTQHKKICACGDEQYANHNWNTGVVTIPATEETTGVKTYTCMDCSETKSEVIPKADHNHSYVNLEKHDETLHKKICICGDVQYVNHNWDSGVVTTPPTTEVAGLKTFTCQDCNEVKTEDIPQVEHVHTNDPTIKKDSNGHWYECSECCEKIAEETHVFEWEVDKEATASETGSKHEECKICHYQKDPVTVDKLVPHITKGTGVKWSKGSNTSLVFISDAAYADFIEVLVDGKIIEKEFYNKRDGGIIIELKATYIETLMVGEHTITIRSCSGDATTIFMVNEKPAMSLSDLAKTLQDKISSLWGDVASEKKRGIIAGAVFLIIMAVIIRTVKNKKRQK